MILSSPAVKTALFVLPLVLPLRVYGSAIINEIAWMGTNDSYSNEWIELYNKSDAPILLDGYSLISKDNIPKIELNGKIPAQGFFLLERTDDNTIPEIQADLIYKGALSNTGEYLKLIDNQGKVIDEIDCYSGWFAGNNETKQTMERKNPLASGNSPENWQASQDPEGTPKAQNNARAPEDPQPQGSIPETKEEDIPPDIPKDASGKETEKDLTEDGPPLIEPELKIEPIVYPSGVIVNEVLPSAEGPDAENEWIEIKNKNNKEVDLSGWKIKDETGQTTTYVFPQGTKIKANGFLALKRPDTKITLNNSGDGLQLFHPDGNMTDKMAYEKALLNQSYNLTASGWAWSNNLSPGAENVIPEKISEIEKSTNENKEVSKNQELSPEKGTAAIKEQFNEKISVSFPLLIGLPAAMFSGAVILILKKKLGKFDLFEKLE